MTSSILGSTPALTYAPSHLRYEMGVHLLNRSSHYNMTLDPRSAIQSGHSSEPQDGSVRHALLQEWYSDTGTAALAPLAPPHPPLTASPPAPALYANPSSPQHAVSKEGGGPLKSSGTSEQRNSEQTPDELARELAAKDATIAQLQHSLQRALDSQSSALGPVHGAGFVQNLEGYNLEAMNPAPMSRGESAASAQGQRLGKVGGSGGAKGEEKQELEQVPDNYPGRGVRILRSEPLAAGAASVPSLNPACPHPFLSDSRLPCVCVCVSL